MDHLAAGWDDDFAESEYYSKGLAVHLVTDVDGYVYIFRNEMYKVPVVFNIFKPFDMQDNERRIFKMKIEDVREFGSLVKDNLEKIRCTNTNG